MDLNDRLLINDGNGFFTDESSARMTAAMRGSSFGTSAKMDDMNKDGFLDIISISGSGQTGGLTRSSIAYNNPNNEGFFNVLQEPYNGAPYHVATGDLNQDGLPDLIISDDADDRYLLNEGNDVFGRVIWSPAYTYGGGNDLGFASNNLILDLDQDGWDEAIFCDVDVDLTGCGNRLQVYHNRGGTAGGFVTLYEESGGGSTGALGLPQLSGAHDVAIFDLDNDGDLDMVVGRCGGTDVFLNQLDSMGEVYCDPAAVNSAITVGEIRATGSPVAEANDLNLAVSGLPNNRFAYFLVGQTRTFIANPGGSQGNLCVGGATGRFNRPGEILSSGTTGMINLDIDTTDVPGPNGTAVIQPGQTWTFTCWYRDVVAGQSTSNFSSAVAIEFR